MKICDPDLCTGCSACANICLQNCILIETNQKGFLSPTVDERHCIQCGQCITHCPQNDSVKLERYQKPEVFAAFSKKEKQMRQSTSGGIFPLLAEQIIEMKGCVYGAYMDETFHVSFMRSKTEDELKKLQGSKYVQANVGMIYQQVLSDLKLGKMVLFSGVPCQVGGLYSFLGRDYENLYTVDMVCRGVPSEKVLKKYIEWREEEENSKITDLIFRHKEKNWGPMSYGTRMYVRFKNGKQYSSKMTSDAYYSIFLKNIAMMESCYHCRFNGFPRVADITLGDYAGLGVIKMSQIHNQNGISQILLNSKKGKELFDKCTDFIVSEKRPLDECCWFNLNLWLSSVRNPNRDKFFSELDLYGMEHVVNKYIHNSNNKIIQMIKDAVIMVLGERRVLLLMHKKRISDEVYPKTWFENQYIKGKRSV